VPSDRLGTLDSMFEGTWEVRPCPRREVSALSQALGIGETTASVLARRGYGDPEEAKAFLAAADPGHDPFTLGAMAEAVASIRAAIAGGRRICVHGDYDVDGIAATALALLGLRSLGADVDWHLPSRFEEGYGVAGETMARLADEGCGLVLTVDCGITAVAEVADARARGLDVVVTDHHRPGETLPDCPVVAPRPSAYPFPELCGTGVVYKLLQALEVPDLDRHLDLVGLATVADVVPLVDENRYLVSAGLRRLARTSKIGLRALMKAARVDPASVDAGAVGFRLAPRINAAGRLGNPSVALELLLTEDAGEAERLAGELETLNRDRQAVEDRILRDAIRQVGEWPEPAQRRRGYVLHGEDWHRGVIGIVASRLVEKFGRPVVLLAPADGGWVGSGRSVSAFDLHGALGACSEHLTRWGGHRAAAGLSLEPESLDAFARAFAAHADSVLGEEDLAPTLRVDAVVDGRDLTLGLCEELAQLAPFGLGNPGVTLLAAGCELSELGAVGEGKHLKLAVTANGSRSGAIAFGWGERLDRYRRPGRYDVAFRLDANKFNGTVTPQLLVKRIYETPDRYEDLRLRLAAEWKAGPDAWSPEARAIFEELGLEPGVTARRSLAESETFRALLAEPFAPAAAAA
jgi:single-stranded-DNA-specific exonuclease